MAHLKAELWLVHWYQNKHGGHKSNKAFENKCYLLYEINTFWINNSQVRKVIHGWFLRDQQDPTGSSPGFQARLKPRLEIRRLAGGISWSRRQSTMDSLNVNTLSPIWMYFHWIFEVEELIISFSIFHRLINFILQLFTYLAELLVHTIYSTSSVYGFWKLKLLVRSQTHSRFLARKRYITDITCPFSLRTVINQQMYKIVIN